MQKDSARKLVCPCYERLYSKVDKFFGMQKKWKRDTVTIDWIKAAHIDQQQKQ